MESAKFLGIIMRIRDIITLIEHMAPSGIAEEWDNVGMQVGDPDGETNGCLLAVDVTVETVREAKRCGAGVIIAHHPVLFAPAKRITPATPSGRAILAAVRTGVALYAAHTNLDSSLEFGTAAALADRLGLTRGKAMLGTSDAATEPLYRVEVTGDAAAVAALAGHPGSETGNWCGWPVNVGGEEGKTGLRGEMALPAGAARKLAAAAEAAGALVTMTRCETSGDGYGMGMIADVPEMPLDALGEYVGRRLATKHVTLAGDPESNVSRIALLPGAGGGLVEVAAKYADAMVTGEAKYHEALRAQELGLGLVLAGHYETERPVLDLLARYLAEQTGGELTIAVTQTRTDPFRALSG